jgi:hypothetical protein
VRAANANLEEAMEFSKVWSGILIFAQFNFFPPDFTMRHYLLSAGFLFIPLWVSSMAMPSAFVPWCG